MLGLSIWINGILAAHIHFDVTTQFSLSYTDEWLQYDQNFPFSPVLPLNPSENASPERHNEAVRNFFSNLLPEGQILEDVRTTYRIRRNDVFGLLAHIGRDCAGALCILPVNMSPQTDFKLRPISYEELSQRIHERPLVPFTLWDEQIRMSMAGFQDKLAVYQDQEKNFYICEGTASSTHLLKPNSIHDEFPHMVANEHFCMTLAKKIGLNVADVELIRVPEPILVITRYDRRLEQNQIFRMHQIDACQVLNSDVNYKYEAPFAKAVRIGINLQELFEITKQTISPAAAQLQMLRWILFQVFIGNTDAHAKNYSFLLNHQGMTSAPNYDMVCGTVYGFDDLAMAIGDEFNIHQLGAYQWHAFAKECSLSKQLLVREMKRFSKLVLQYSSELLGSSVYNEDERAFLKKIADYIHHQAAHHLELAPEILRVPQDL